MRKACSVRTVADEKSAGSELWVERIAETIPLGIRSFWWELRRGCLFCVSWFSISTSSVSIGADSHSLTRIAARPGKPVPIDSTASSSRWGALFSRERCRRSVALKVMLVFVEGICYLIGTHSGMNRRVLKHVTCENDNASETLGGLGGTRFGFLLDRFGRSRQLSA